MWYISFQGENDGDVNNILVYHDDGKSHSNPNLLPTGGTNPVLKELRGFVIADNLLYVVNAYKEYSQILLYQSVKKGGYTPATEPIFASKQNINAIVHPFDLTFDTDGNCYISSQDTNVVTAVKSANNPLPAASYLTQQYPPPDHFLAGTFVASSVGALPLAPAPSPANVLLPQGLGVNFTDSTKTKVAHSVRGVIYYNGYLYVADEPANAVKVYDGKTGEIFGQIMGSNLIAPVHLFLHGNVIYIGSTGNDSVVCYDLANGAPLGTVSPTTFIDNEVKHVSGLAVDANGCFYAAERHAKKIKQFTSTGKKVGDFITNLPDEPEFILYVPKLSSIEYRDALQPD